MASLNEIAHSYADSVGKGLDVQFVRRVKFSIKYWRAKLVRQEAERTPLNAAIEQSFIDRLIDVDELDSCIVESGCKLKRTMNPVPKPIQIKGSDPFRYVGPAGILCPEDIPFVYSPPAEIANAQFKNWTANVVRYFYRNNYIYTTKNCLRKYIRVTHTFEDPIKAAEKCNTAASCIDDDDEFPIGAHMLDTILAGLLSGEMRLRVPDNEVLIEAGK